jgi:asparagine synthase (glutamine-hydrolysing)
VLVDFEGSAAVLAGLIDGAVAEAIGGEPQVAVAFSGGLDSSVVAKCAMRHTRVIACTAFAAGAGDASRAKKGADALGLELRVVELTEETVASELVEIRLPFEPTLMDRSLWCLYSEVSKSAKESGSKVMLLGQMADELFGGYAKYAEALAARGAEEARRMMEADAKEYRTRGRIRDTAACRPCAQARFPFEAEEIAEFAGAIPMDFKIREGVRKAVLRRAAVILGLPDEVAAAPKKAAQYSSGVQKLVAASHF